MKLVAILFVALQCCSTATVGAMETRLEAGVAAPSVAIVGVYRIKARPEPVVLVELWIKNYTGTIDFGKFQQDVPRLGPAREQVPWLEHELNPEGTSGRELPLEGFTVKGRARIAFFLHYPQHGQPLQTPFGSVVLPGSAPLPKRLRFMKYSVPD